MKIVVLAGGISSERNVSLSTGTLVHQALLENGHEAVLLDIYLGCEVLPDSLENLFSKGWDFTKAGRLVDEAVPDLQAVKAMRKDSKSFFGPNVLALCSYSDIAFIALHGDAGEDGRVQAAFELLGIPYTGTGYFGSAVAMSKKMTRKLLISENILMAKGMAADAKSVKAEDLIDAIGLPLVVKPSNGGSSIGVYICQTPEELIKAIAEADYYDHELIFEAYIKGREFSVGVINKKALPVIEIIPKTGFYDYANKYQAGFTEEICPARLSQDQTREVQGIAERVHEILCLGSYSRVDFLLSEDGRFYCLEANTLPGMTPTSLLPQEAQAMGISYSELCSLIIKTSMDNWR